MGSHGGLGLEWRPLGDLDKELVPSEIQEGRGGVSPPSGWDAEKTLREAGTRMEKGSQGWVRVSLGIQIGQYLTCGELGRRAWGSEVCSSPTGRIELGAGLETGEAGVPGTPQTRTTQVAQAAASSSSAALRAQGSGVTQRASQGGRQQGQAPQEGSGFWLWVPSGLGLRDDIRFNATQFGALGGQGQSVTTVEGVEAAPGRPVRGPQLGGVTAGTLRFPLPERHAGLKPQARINASRTQSPPKTGNHETCGRKP